MKRLSLYLLICISCVLPQAGCATSQGQADISKETCNIPGASCRWENDDCYCTPIAQVHPVYDQHSYYQGQIDVLEILMTQMYHTAEGLKKADTAAHPYSKGFVEALEAIIQLCEKGRHSAIDNQDGERL